MWLTPIVSATWEAEMRGSLEHRSLRLQRAINMPLHSSPGDRGRLRLLKKVKKIKKIAPTLDSDAH